MKIKTLFFLLIIPFLTQCGFEPIYLKKNINITINEIEKENTALNNEISNALKKIYNNTDAAKILNLTLNSNKIVSVKSKDNKGDPLIFELKIEAELDAMDQNNSNYNKKFSRNISFKNTDDKFELSRYQSDLEKLLIKKLIEDMNSFLAEIQ